LVPLCPAFLEAVLKHDLTEAERILGLSLPDGLLDSTDVMSLRLQQLQADATFQPWSLRAIALRDCRAMVGHIGCHTAPGAEYLRPHSPGGVEFGFTVYPPFRRQGYAREASVALMRWAHRIHGVTRFVLSIRPDNMASQSLAAGLGFVRIGFHIDEEDGLEEILERRDCDGDAD
jgi:RimJ/RimL family protein N-acetyltransferase